MSCIIHWTFARTEKPGFRVFWAAPETPSLPTLRPGSSGRALLAKYGRHTDHKVAVLGAITGVDMCIEAGGREREGGLMSAFPPKRTFSQTGSRAGLRLRLRRNDNRKTMGVRHELYDLKERAETGQPPRRRLLNQVSIPTIGEHLLGRPGCDGKEAVPHRDRSEIGDHRINKVRFDVLEHINATNEIGWPWIAVVGERWIIWEVVKIDDAIRREATLQIAFPGAVIRERFRARLADDVGNDGCICERSGAVIRVFVQLLLQRKITGGYSRSHRII